MASNVIISIADSIATITLADPASLNAMNENMADQFANVVSELQANSSVRVLILRGEGRAFSAGGDLMMLQGKTFFSEEENYHRMLAFYDSFLQFYFLNIPAVAVLHGSAVGAGLCMACAADIRIAEEGTRLGFSFTKLGLHPGMGATYFLPKVVGEAAAHELLLTGRLISSGEAQRIGLISGVAEVGRGYERAVQIANEILTNGPLATRQLIQTLRGSKEQLQAALKHEARQQAINYSSLEFKEGIEAARERRKAVF